MRPLIASLLVAPVALGFQVLNSPSSSKVSSFQPSWTCGEDCLKSRKTKAAHSRATTSVAALWAKKKGPASSFDLDALEALEAQLYGDSEEGSSAESVDSGNDAAAKADDNDPAADNKKQKKKNKKQKSDVVEPLEVVAEGTEKSGGSGGGSGKKTKGGKKGPASSFDLEKLEALENQFYGKEEDDRFYDKEKEGGAEEGAPGYSPTAGGAAASSDTDGEEWLSLPAKKNKSKNKSKNKKNKGGDDSDVASPAEENALAAKAKAEEEEEEAAAAAAAALEEEEEVSLEDQIRKARPPPRIQVAESSQPGFVSMRLNQVGVVFKNQEVLSDATWEVKTGERVGLVGPNGCGKTTMIKILAGDLEQTTGDLVKSSVDLRVALLRQEFTEELVLSRTLREELTSVFREGLETLQKLADSEAKLATLTGPDQAEDMQAVLDEMEGLQEKAKTLEAYSHTGKVDKVLDAMGFTKQEADFSVASFSGGWKMRIGLGKILLQDPNILLLDEPTNHLDLESVEWLEKFLVQQNIPMVIVSHDREFLDQVATKIVDVSEGVCSTYQGNYNRFLKLKALKLDAWESAYGNQQKKIKEERQWINANKNKAQTASSRAQREAKLEKLLKGEGSEELVSKPPRGDRKFRFRFPPPPRSAGVDEVAYIDEFSHGYGPRTLFENVDLVIESKDRVAFLGPNGAGKSTLLRCLVGKEQPLQGTAGVGSSVVCNYFEQNQADAMDVEDSVMGVIEKASTVESYEQLRALLGQFLFKGDEVEKKISQLSGGEKARVALCRMMLQPCNLLVLDEPTNHLDIPAKEMLEEALQHYEGAMLLISHDRYFISQVATTVVAIEDKQLQLYIGDYRFYMENRPEVKEKVAARLVKGDKREIGNAKVVATDLEDKGKARKKNFGGGGGPSGDKTKGIKNAKRNSSV